MRCTYCGHADYRHNLQYCPQCSEPIWDSGRQLPSGDSTRSTSVPAVARRAELAVRQQFDVTRFGPSIQRVYRERYLAEETLGRNSPFWSIRKHVAALRALEAAKEYIPIQEELQKEAYMRLRRQAVDVEMARRRAAQEDEIRREQLLSRTNIWLDYMDTLTRHFYEGDRYSDLTDEQKKDLIESLSEIARETIFSEPASLSTRQEPPQPLGPDITIIDVDEF